MMILTSEKLTSLRLVHVNDPKVLGIKALASCCCCVLTTFKFVELNIQALDCALQDCDTD